MTCDVVCIGEALIDFVPTEPDVALAQASSFRKAAGGAPANVAVGLARLGVAPAFIGMVGDDPFGEYLVRTLEAAGVEVTAMRRSSESLTSLAFVSPARDCGDDFLFYRQPGADTLLSMEHIDEHLISRARIVHFGSIGLIDEPSRSATLHAIHLARQSRCRLSCDVNLRLRLWPGPDAARAGLGFAIRNANIVKLSDAELEFVSGTRDPRIGLRELWHDQLDLAVVTHGENGCTWVSRDAAHHVEPFEVDSVDPTGAGDGFTAGLIARIVNNPTCMNDPGEISRACRFANAVGALTVAGWGGIPALPIREDVERLVNGF
jgi:fructokinase